MFCSLLPLYGSHFCFVFNLLWWLLKMIIFCLIVCTLMVKIISTEVMLWKNFFVKSPCGFIFQVLRQNWLTPNGLLTQMPLILCHIIFLLLFCYHLTHPCQLQVQTVIHFHYLVLVPLPHHFCLWLMFTVTSRSDITNLNK